jgi:hypothetical protein
MLTIAIVVRMIAVRMAAMLKPGMRMARERMARRRIGYVATAMAMVESKELMDAST